MLISVQALRALAAWAVVCHHFMQIFFDSVYLMHVLVLSAGRLSGPTLWGQPVFDVICLCAAHRRRFMAELRMGRKTQLSVA